MTYHVGPFLSLREYIYMYIGIFIRPQQYSKANVHRKVDPSGGMISLLLERISGTLKAVCHIWVTLQNLFPTFFQTTSVFTVRATEVTSKQ